MTDLARATAVLDAIAEASRPLTVSELATRIQLPRSSVHRAIQALERELYVVRGAQHPGYSLGPGVLKFGMNAHLQLLSATRGHLVALARAVNENVELAVFSGREVVIAAQIASPERLKGVSRLGKSFSLHASSIGKAVLAQLPDERVRELLPRSLHRFTPHTLVRRPDLLAALATIRRCHIAVDLEEHDTGICSVATAIVGTGALQAIAVVIPTRRFAAKADLAIECLCQANPQIQPGLAREQYATHRRQVTPRLDGPSHSVRAGYLTPPRAGVPDFGTTQ